MTYQVTKMINAFGLSLTHSFLADTEAHSSDECSGVSTAVLITHIKNSEVNHALLSML